MTLKWNGNKIIKKKNQAVGFAINEVMKNSQVHALNNHPGWRYRTGVAETSIQIKDFATTFKHVGLWGSIWTQQGQRVTDQTTGAESTVPETNYVWQLEFNHGSFLRKAANVIYPSLAREIKKKFKLLTLKSK
jgi:hypothetical protein